MDKMTPPPQLLDFKENEIHLQVVAEMIQLSYFFNGEDGVLNRPLTEPIEKMLNRLSKSLLLKSMRSKLSSKKGKGKSDQQRQECVDSTSAWVTLQNGDIIDVVGRCNKDLDDGMSINLGSLCSFIIVKNAPVVTSFSTFPRSKCYEGCPIVPQICMDNSTGCDVAWYISTGSDDKEYQYRSSSSTFSPGTEDVGGRLKVYCTPYREQCKQSQGKSVRGRTVSFYLSGRVHPMSSPKPRILEYRPEFDISLSSQSNGACMGSDLEEQMTRLSIEHDSSGSGRDSDLRIVSYNILAETFATQDYAVEHLYPFCDKQFLETEYRCQIIVAELRAYDTDIICLQECEHKLFQQMLSPVLTSCGLDGVYTNKSSGVREGCAMFVRRSRLRLLRSIDVPLKNILREALYLEGLYAARPDLVDVIGGKLGTIAQISVCEIVGGSTSSSHIIIIANTHLFYHPDADFIRCLQMHAIVSLLDSLKLSVEKHGISGIDTIYVHGEERNGVTVPIPTHDDRLQTGASSVSTRQEEQEARLMSTAISTSTTIRPKVSVILAGDFNSSPDAAAMEYLLRGSVSSDHDVWKTINGFHWGSRMSEVGGVTTETYCSNNVLEESKSKNTLSNNSMNRMKIHDNDNRGVEGSVGIYPSLSHSFSFCSAGAFPRYSNYTRDFKDLLDYIMVDRCEYSAKILREIRRECEDEANMREGEDCDNDSNMHPLGLTYLATLLADREVKHHDFEVTKIGKFPPETVLKQYTALPSEYFASDHIAIVVDLKLVKS